MPLIEQFTNYTATTAGLQKLYRDQILNPGSKFLLDFLDPTCNPNADGTLPAGTTFVNLVDGANGGIINTSSTMANLTGKTGLSVPGSGGGNLTIGNAGDYDLHVSNDEFIVIVWFKTPASGFISTSFLNLFSEMVSNTNTAQFYSDMGSDGQTPRIGYGNGTISSVLALASGTGLGAVTQLGMHIKPAAHTLELYYNGGFVSNSVGPPPNTLQNAATLKPTLNAGYKGTVYRLYMEDITVSSAANSAISAAGQIALDYAQNSSRFT